jgi:hypothetical protein
MPVLVGVFELNHYQIVQTRKGLAEFLPGLFVPVRFEEITSLDPR